MRRAWKVSAVALLLLTFGLHWALLQTVAWTSMIVAYSAEVGLQEGLRRTFDGQHPCALCKAIEKGRAEEKQHPQKSSKTSGKLDPAEAWKSLELDFWQPFEPPQHEPRAWPVRHEPPPKPRPRLTAA